MSLDAGYGTLVYALAGQGFGPGKSLAACVEIGDYFPQQPAAAFAHSFLTRILGLRFLGFEFKDPTPQQAYQSLFPEEITMTDLRLWDELEARDPNVFSGMYQFWCQEI